jgi:chitin disaccharide deacetylase
LNFLKGTKNFVLGPPGGEHKASLDQRLTARIGHPENASLLIIKCDDLGSSTPANAAIEHAMREGIATSATLMVPPPSARDAAEHCHDLDVGVHLTLTSEYPTYRWRSITEASSLHDADGYLPRTIGEVWAHADLTDVAREWQAQIEQALEWGVDVTHLDSHMDVHQLDRHYFALYLRLAEHYRLPVRVRQSGIGAALSSVPRSLAQHGVLTPDRLESAPWGDPARPALMKCIESRRKGVTEFMVHPVEPSEELFAYDTENADSRVADAECLMDKSLRTAIAARGVTLIGFRPLREAMRTQIGGMVGAQCMESGERDVSQTALSREPRAPFSRTYGAR